MTKPSKSTSRLRKNPLSRFMFWLSIALFAFIGITTVTGQQRLLAEWIVYILLFTSICCAAWAICGFQSGRISIVGSTGQLYTYRRTKEPVAFFIWFIIYLGASIFLAAFMACRLLTA